MQSDANQTQRPILEWAMRLCPESSRTRVKDWISAGRFYLNGVVITQAGLRIADPGAALTFGQPDNSVHSWIHRKRIHPKLVVLFLDEDVAVVDKAAGLLSVPRENDDSGVSALDILEDYINDPLGITLRRQLFGDVPKVKPLPVHRLDQFTSGLLCIAMNPEARSSLIDQLRSGDLLREYVAFADGTARSKSGTWRHYLKLDEQGYRQSLHPKPVPGGTEAVTHYTVEEVFTRNNVSRLRLRLETGLKHQIRLQSAAEGMPLVGDRLYHQGTRQVVERKGGNLPYGVRRQALHAASIGFKHPQSGQLLRFDAKLPKDMQELEDRLRHGFNRNDA